MVVVQPTKKGEKMWTDYLRQFHFWCQKTLPLVYDDSLSYYEVLAKVTKHLNELTTLVNEIGDELERYEGVTDNRLGTLETWRTEVDTWRTQIDEWKTDVNTWIEQTDAWKQSTENHLTAHDNWISYATGLINNTIMPFIEDMTTRVGDIENRLSGAEDDIHSLRSDVTSLDSRLDDAESSIVGLDGRLDTAENDITTISGRVDGDEGDIEDIQDDVTDLQNRVDKLSIIIKGVVLYDSTNNKWLFDILHSADKDYLLSKIDNSNYLSTALSHYTIFTCVFGSANYNYEELVLSYGSSPLQYEQHDIYITVPIPPTTDAYYKDFYNTGDIYYIDTGDPVNARICRLPSYKLLDLPIPVRGDDGKVVAYNNTTKKYELITPSGGSSHTYSTTEHEVGTWVDGSTVYERTLTGSWSSDTTTNIQIPQGVTILELQGFVYRIGSGSSQSYYPIYSGDMWIDSDNSQIGVIHSLRNWGSSGTNKYFVTIRYVKELYRP